MSKFLLSVCVTLILAVTLTVGGVLAVFQYARSEASPDSKNIKTELDEFVYGNYPPGFTIEMQTVLDVAMNDKTYGLNAPESLEGMKFAMGFSSIFGGRAGYGYVGTMDNVYGDKVYGKTVYKNISVVLTFHRYVNGEDTIYMYFVKKTKEELTAMDEYETLDNVYRATFIKDESTANDWDLHMLADNTPDVVKGSSEIRYYQGQTDETKTFGCYDKTEIWTKY